MGVVAMVVFAALLFTSNDTSVEKGLPPKGG
jgi:hypothetical protein